MTINDDNDYYDSDDHGDFYDRDDNDSDDIDDDDQGQIEYTAEFLIKCYRDSWQSMKLNN